MQHQAEGEAEEGLHHQSLALGVEEVGEAVVGQASRCEVIGSVVARDRKYTEMSDSND